MAVAKIGDTTYDTLSAAITAANATSGSVIIDLIDNIVLASNLTIQNNITIQGNYTMSRTTSYIGTLFTIKANKVLTLDGGIVLECGNNWTMDMEIYNNALYSAIQLSSYTDFFTPEDGGVSVTAPVFNTTGTLNLNNITIRNHFGVSQRLVTANSGAKINLNGAQILHCAIGNNSGLVVDAANSTIQVTINEGTLIDDCFVGNNHGLFKMYSGAKTTMNGGVISNIRGYNSNGVVIGLYGTGSTFTMNGGSITHVCGIMSASNGRNAPIYVHRNGVFIMNGGTIAYNMGTSCGGIDAPYTTDGYTSTVTINNGVVAYNQVTIPTYANNCDIRGNDKVYITGGTYTQDVSRWCTEDYAAVQLSDGTWGVKTTLFQAYACMDGIIYKADMYVCKNGVIYKVDGIQSRLVLN